MPSCLPPAALACSAVTLVALGVLLGGERRASECMRLASKPVASAGFVGTALASGALGSAFGRWVLAALVLSMLGDVLLLGRRNASFVAGLLAFLAGHLAYAGAFVVRGVELAWTAAAAALLAAIGAGVGRWLWPHVERPMRAPVVAYIVVICAMVALSVGTAAASPAAWLVVAALAFWVSDLAVARDRFVTPGFANRAWGLPLYYGAQLLFAWSLP